SIIQNGHNIIKETASSINDNRTFADLLKEVLNSTDLSDMNITVDFQCNNSST
ncbi:1737_t:CDS:1, partial [Funneliformis caledonium]